MARPAVSYRALALRADDRAAGVIAGVYALLPLFAAVPLGRRTDYGRCTPLDHRTALVVVARRPGRPPAVEAGKRNGRGLHRRCRERGPEPSGGEPFDVRAVYSRRRPR